MMNYEVLAPVGKYQELQEVLSAAPDAIYVGLKGCTSRPAINDFAVEQIIEATRICHGNNVKIYVAINSVISNNYINTLIEQLKVLDNAGVDAFILADYGAIKVACEMQLNSAIHASTLLGVYNITTVRILQSMGVSRIIFYANLYFDEIAQIINAVPEMEYELVAEGGTCFNDIRQCRLPHVTTGGQHILSCRSGCILCDGDELIKGKLLAEHPSRVAEIVGIYMGIGITSFKIEGRTVPAIERIPIIYDLKKYIQNYLDGKPLRSYLHYLNRTRREVL